MPRRELGQFVEKPRAAAIVDVRRALAGTALADDEPPRRLSFSWCTPGISLGLRGIVEGAEIAVRLNDGRVFVGALSRVHKDVLCVRPWGGRGRRFGRASIAAAAVLGPHRWVEAQAVRQRQARGEPALIVRAIPGTTPWKTGLP